jgi:hypothetical protein
MGHISGDDIKQRPVPSPDADKWYKTGWEISYTGGKEGYRPGMKDKADKP